MLLTAGAESGCFSTTGVRKWRSKSHWGQVLDGNPAEFPTRTCPHWVQNNQNLPPLGPVGPDHSGGLPKVVPSGLPTTTSRTRRAGWGRLVVVRPRIMAPQQPQIGCHRQVGGSFRWQPAFPRLPGCCWREWPRKPCRGVCGPPAPAGNEWLDPNFTGFCWLSWLVDGFGGS